MMAPLTTAALRRTGREAIAQSYLDRLLERGGLTPFEPLDFLAYVADQAAAPPIARAVARFERALLLARHPRAAVSVVAFPAPAEEILGALLTGAPLPAPATLPSFVLVDPALPQLWRPLDPDEAARMDPPGR
jgi:hypothetical protein